jgi:hypothetical protein
LAPPPRALSAAGANVTIADLNAERGGALAEELGAQFVAKVRGVQDQSFDGNRLRRGEAHEAITCSKAARDQIRRR